MALGTIKGQMILDVKQALAAYTAARLAHLSTMTALSTGASALRGVSLGMAAAGAGIAAGIMVAVNAAAEFERKLDYFSAVSASTQEEYEAIRAKALELGQDTIYSAGQIADSFVELGKAGVSAGDIVNGIGEAVANLGAAADIPLDTASNILMSAVQTFGLSADHAVEVADKLAGAANASIVEVQDLGISFKYAGGVANALGLSFDDVNSALAMLGTYGIKGSTAGTSLRQTLVSLTGSTKKAVGTLTDLGIITEDGGNKFFDSEGKAKSLGEIFQILQDATADLSDEQRIAALKSIFQSRALSTVLALTKEGAAGFAEMHAEIGKTTALDVANERLDNLSGDIEILRGNLETLAIESGSQLQEFARQVVQAVTSAVQWFANLSDGTQMFILKALAFASIGMVMIGVLGLLASGVLSMINMAIRLAQVFQLLRLGLLAVRVAMVGVNLAFLANPITWIIAGIAALIAAFVLLWKNNEGFRNFFIDMWGRIKTAVSAVVDWFKGLPAWFSSVWESIKTTATTVWNAIVTFITGIPQMLLDAFLNFTLIGLLIQHWDTIWLGIQTAWNAILEFFAALPGNIANFFAELPGMVGYWIGFMVGTAIRWFADMTIRIVTLLTTWYQNVIGFFQRLPGNVIKFVTTLRDKAVALFANLMARAIRSVTELYNGVIDWFQKLPGRVGAFLAGLVATVLDKMSAAKNYAVSKAKEIFAGIIDWFQKLPDRVRGIWDNVTENIRQALSAAWSKALDLASKIYNGVVDGIKGIPDTVKGIFNNVVNAIKEKIAAAFNAVKDFASNMWEGFKNGLGINSPSLIEKQMVQITEVTETETDKLRRQVGTLQGIGNNLSGMSAKMGQDFTAGMAPGLELLANQVAQADRYRSTLDALSAGNTAFDTYAGYAGGLQNEGTTTIYEGDNVTLEVTWNASPDDNINNRQQVKDLLSQAGFVAGKEVGVGV